MIEQVRYFEADTSHPLTLDCFLDYYGISLIEFYRPDGTRSLFRLKKWAELIQDDRDAEDNVYKKFAGLLHTNSKPLLEYWVSYISDLRTPQDDRERIMRNMLYYSFYKKEPSKEGFDSIEEGIRAITKYDFVRDELLQILKYNLKHIDFVACKNEYSFECPLEVHCNYNTRQIMAAFDYFNEEQAPEFREGVKFFRRKED